MAPSHYSAHIHAHNSTYIRRTDGRTFVFAELVEGGESGGVVGVVRFERDAEEVAVGRDVVTHVRRLGATHPTHLAVR